MRNNVTYLPHYISQDTVVLVFLNISVKCVGPNEFAGYLQTNFNRSSNDSSLIASSPQTNVNYVRWPYFREFWKLKIQACWNVSVDCSILWSLEGMTILWNLRVYQCSVGSTEPIFRVYIYKMDLSTLKKKAVCSIETLAYLGTHMSLFQNKEPAILWLLSSSQQFLSPKSHIFWRFTSKPNVTFYTIHRGLCFSHLTRS